MDTKFNLDLKTLVMIISFAVSLAGMYYSLTSRVDALEYTLKTSQSEIGVLRDRLDNANKRINKLRKHHQSKK